MSWRWISLYSDNMVQQKHSNKLNSCHNSSADGSGHSMNWHRIPRQAGALHFVLIFFSVGNLVFPIQLGFVSFVYTLGGLQVEVLLGCQLKCSLFVGKATLVNIIS